MLTIKTFVFNPFQENTYLLVDSETHQAIVVDPGMSSNAEQRIFDQYVEENKISITQIVNTHLHIDHCLGAAYVRSRYGAPMAASPNDSFLGERLAEQARMFGMIAPDELVQSVKIDIDLKDGDNVLVGKSRLAVIATPGHSPGGIALYDAEDGFVITGDSLFRSSIGRTDLPGGDHHRLIDSVTKRLLTLPPDTIIYPGHGPRSTVALELATNPFIH